MKKTWSQKLPVAQFRIARPTNQLQKVIEFYRDGVGLEVVGSFEGHDGYDGVMLGLPDTSYHLEFTQHEHGSPCPPPTADNLLVFYIPDLDARNGIVNRLKEMGYGAVSPENPYWNNSGVTIEDPDGWRIVLQNSYTLNFGE
ncbi:VOC family protein [Lederbergia wuyishanensis]|uniref:Catechol 2,3-dioxygenase-like lactoylglutathione lyase family enzyme n=1 Tax=Lederbergia wuyishanensis TaxID=1347903 RepID=A0ABU0D3M3_9BACI|nr:VOC family protein [Lederbergia wuyishanensis]MCJ8007828.1 VOC family protein [Lederbergia wuyishanensis]MDQ0343004.1 catechol 2,3-dioxygenase-like lactoylglutathione lyase family enzyme [Lederbergia wuyishanensis]